MRALVGGAPKAGKAAALAPAAADPIAHARQVADAAISWARDSPIDPPTSPSHHFADPDAGTSTSGEAASALPTTFKGKEKGNSGTYADWVAFLLFHATILR